ncbi:hypothetical protein ACLQ2Y_27460 [Micromonospora echinospora]|uniref:SLATT domain-containing protein n=1 Tax=Micromonospora echinospora TaxID=1877 RepID=UPI003CE7700D
MLHQPEGRIPGQCRRNFSPPASRAISYDERSCNSQQAADAIEREYEAVELRVGKYATLEESETYALFADTVERLRDEQNKRQQQLDQPVEATREE